MPSFRFLFIYIVRDQFKEEQRGWECGTYRGKEKCIPDSDNLKERDLGVAGKYNIVT
jgi:hypothetical protein